MKDEEKSKAHLIAELVELRQRYDQILALTADLSEAEEALRQSEAQNRALLDTLPDLILQTRHDGTFLGYRVGGLRPYVPPERFVGRTIEEVLPAFLTRQIRENVEQARATGQTQVFEHKMPTVRGLRDYEARVVPSSQDEVLIIVRDITDRKRQEQQAIRAARLAALGMLAAALAHEINNPLQIVQSHLDLLMEFPLTPEEREAYLKIIGFQMDRLNAITRRVLNFARPQPAPRERISVTRLARQMLVLAAQQLQHRGVQVTTDFQTVLPVEAVADQIDQVLLNLLLNAIESVPVKGRIHIAIFPDGDTVAVSVTSNSPPIPRDVLPYIFEAFFTTKPEGTGLGLWISHDLVQQHQGTITAENLPGDAGVAFTVRLPAAPTPYPEVPP